MTTAFLSYYATGGYKLRSAYDKLIITPGGGAGGAGVDGNGGFNTIVNYGHVRASGVYAGVSLEHGGAVTNASGGYVSGVEAIYVAGGSGTAANYGTVTGTSSSLRGAVRFFDGGVVTNGSGSNTSALIDGREGVTVQGDRGSVTNFATIKGQLTSGGLHGVYLGNGGGVTNGSASDHAAYIAGFQSGVAINNDRGTVHNFALIRGLQVASGQAGVSFAAGGYVSNGSSSDTTAAVRGEQGVIVNGGAGTVDNFGDIEGTGSSVRGGVALYDGGVVNNGTSGLITGHEGVTVKGAAGSVTNLGVILGSPLGSGLHGVWLDDGGTVVNGSASDTGADIDSYQSGVANLGAAMTVRNFGYIIGNQASYGQAGVSAGAAGYVFNGTSADHKALIEGQNGLWLADDGLVSNYATIKATGTESGYGVVMPKGGSLANEAGGLIEGYGGLKMLGIGVNLGEIVGTASGRNSAIGEYGALLIGSGSELTNGSASNKAADIRGYVGVQIDGADTLINYGTIATTARGAVVLNSAAATLEVEAGSAFSGAVLGGGGTLVLASGVGTISGLSGGFVTVSGSMASTLFEDFATFEVASGAAFTDSGPTTLSAGQGLVDDGALTLSGTVANAGQIDLNAARLTVGATGLSLTGAGTVALSDGANKIKGATASSRLNVDQTLEGAGAIGAGQMILAVQKYGVVEATDSKGLVLNTGADSIISVGVIESDGAGGLTIMSAIANSGTLAVMAGTLTVEEAVIGTGIVRISAGTANFEAGVSEDVDFTGTKGTLDLGESQSYAGTIAGFSKTGTTALDLADIAYVAGTTKATYAGTASGGVLTLSEGGHTAAIHFTGDYLGSTWTLSAASGGGTKVVDPTAARSVEAMSGSLAHAFVQALVGLGTSAAHAPAGVATEFWRSTPLATAAPRPQIV